ncbi:hypothetical protein HMPREF9510_01651 [Enterococcus faecalis TX0470]|nr:hypothetical protein HMPREF9510_01651 [Enterococcus faecalis TX0470]
MAIKQGRKSQIKKVCFGTILNNMTLKLEYSFFTYVSRFGTILNNMTLKHERLQAKINAGFGTILNNMTLKPRRIIFSP